MTRPESPSALLAADRVARRAAQTEFERHLVVEAGAGTGKTTTLVARTLLWCLGPGWDSARQDLSKTNQQQVAPVEEPTRARIARKTLEGIVAITFTDKAANEMASRIGAALADLGGGAESPFPGLDLGLLPQQVQAQEVIDRALSLLDNLDRLSVRTFHSFCRNLLAKYPLEAGLHPDLKVDADETILDDVVHRVVERALRASYASGELTPLTELVLSGVDPSEIAETLRRLIAQGLTADLLLRDPWSSDNLETFRLRLLRLLKAVQREIPSGFSELKKTRIPQEVSVAIESAIEATSSCTNLDLTSFTSLVELLTFEWKDSLVRRLQNWGRCEYLQSELQDLPDPSTLSVASLDLAHLLVHIGRLNPARLDLGRQALQPLLKQVEHEMRSAGVATFHSLVFEAYELLRRHSKIAARERRSIRQLLVDESQDSDTLQCDMIRILALAPPSSHRPTLFMVGDPKQSIYGWRDADLEAYSELVSDIVAADGERYALVQNFRSAPPILDEVERVTRPIMLPQPGLQPPFKALVPSEELRDHPGFVTADWAPVEFWVSWQPPSSRTQKHRSKTPVGQAASMEAEAVAADLVKLRHETSVEWKDVGILIRSANRVEVYLEALRRAGIPFSVSRDKQYYRRREIIDCAALVRCVINPVDHLALLTFLRSAVVGVPDVALIPLWSHGFPQLITELEAPHDQEVKHLTRLIREVASELPPEIPGLDRIPGWEHSLMAAVTNLAAARRNFEMLPADLFVEDLRHRFLLEVTEAARYLGDFRVANLDRFFRLLELDLEQAEGDIHVVQQAMQRRIVAAKEADQARPLGALEDSVQVTTIHKAKGLEFRHVYLVGMHSKGGQGRGSSHSIDAARSSAATGEYTLFDAPTLQFDRVELRRRQIAQAERVRTLYVAMTRARERLVLVGCWPEASSPIAVEAAQSYTDLLTNRLETPPSPLELEAAEQTNRNAYGARWKFLQAQVGTGLKIPQTSRAVSRDLDQIRKDSHLLRSHRAKAARRMSQSIHHAASDFVQESLLLPDPAATKNESLAPRVDARSSLSSEPSEQSRKIATVVGDAFHMLFKSWDHSADFEIELEAQRLRLSAFIDQRLQEESRGRGVARCKELFDRLENGQLLQTFCNLGSNIVAREMPLLLSRSRNPDGPDNPAGSDGSDDSDRSEPPHETISGIVDLLYQGEDAQHLVIADFKTDLVVSEASLQQRSAVYADQLRIYARALSRALALQIPPQLELWYVWADRVWPVPLD